MTKVSNNLRGRTWLAMAALLAVSVLLASGCHRRFLSPSSLPDELLAPPVANVKTIDLSKLATHTASNELIERGDVLQVSIETGYEEENTSALLVRVGEDGVGNLPLVGRVPLAGLELEGAEQAIAGAAVTRNIFRNPIVTVLMKRQRMNKVMVLGAVEAPGMFELPRGASSLLAAIVAAGGLSDEAGAAVEIRRPAATPGSPRPTLDRVTAAGYSPPQRAATPVSFHVDLVAATTQERGAHDLVDGDVVMVERRDLQPFDVIGLVTKPGRFDLPANKDLHVLDAVAMAGGVKSQFADRVHVTRHVPGQEEPVVVRISIREAKQQGRGNLRLSPGDVVSIESTPATMFTHALGVVAPYSLAAIIPFLR